MDSHGEQWGGIAFAAEQGNVATTRRTPLWTQLLSIGWLYWLYDAINDLPEVRVTQALAHGSSVLRLEERIGLDVELSMNNWVQGHRVIGLALSDFYDVAHLSVTFVLLVTLWWRASASYPRQRNTLVVINLIGFACFALYPVAPPRMLPNFVDVVSSTHALGSWHSGALGAHANELAAMPSLHMAWAMWCGWAASSALPKRIGIALGALYATLTVLAVLVTANHFVLDLVAGALTFGGAWMVTSPGLANRISRTIFTR